MSLRLCLLWLCLFPHGECGCRVGFTRSPDNPTSCVDINECVEFSRCSQLCENLEGAYQCACAEGFHPTTENNASSCVPTDPSWKLVFASLLREVRWIVHEEDDKEVIHSMAPYESDTDPVILNSVDVSCDARRDMVYWTDSKVIYRVSLHYITKPEVVVDKGLGLTSGIVFDWITGNIYYTDEKKRHVSVCWNARDPSQISCAVLIYEPLGKPMAIALHPNEGLMFWLHGGISKKVMRAGMDGSDVTAIVTTDLTSLYGIAVDWANSRVYFGGGFRNQISSVRLDGSDRRVVIQLGQNSLVHGVAVLGDRIFWCDWQQHEINSADKLTGMNNKTHFTTLDGGTFTGIAIMHPANQPINRGNPCETGNCSSICVLAPLPGSVTFQCLCPNGMELGIDGKNCIEKAVDKTEPVNVSMDGDSETFAKKLNFITLVIILCLVFALAFLMYKRSFNKWRRIRQAVIEINLTDDMNETLL